MNKHICSYVVKARTAYTNKQTNEIEFRVVERNFENENPILAREAAFIFRNEFIHGMLIVIGLTDDEIGWNSSTKRIEKLSDREIRKLINPYLEPEGKEEEESEWEAPDDSISWYSKFKNGIWVIMKHDDSELLNDDDTEIVIDKISRYEEPLPTPPLYTNLEKEYEFYKKHNCETKSYETSVLFFDDEHFLDGFYINEKENESQEDAEERHLAEAFKAFNFLKTPFDWTGYDKINWWEKESNKNEIPKILVDNKNILPVTMEEAFNKEEHHFAEFKPGLLNWRNSNRDMEYENVQAICAFLNMKGGYLFIGVADKGKEVIGLNFQNITREFFRREFTRIKSRFLYPSIAYSIFGDFYFIDEKEVFVVTVYPSDEPVFLRKKDENNKIVTKEFYVRSDAASRHLYDIEEIVKHCRKHWRQ